MQYAKIAALGLSLSAGGAEARQITAADPEAMVAFLQAEGIEALLGKDSYGDPNIEITFYSSNFSLYFYDCDGGANCQSIQFYAGYQTDGSFGSNDANAWNQTHRFSKAYVSDSGNARLERDVYTGTGGLPERDFADVFTNWTHSLAEFEAAIGW